MKIEDIILGILFIISIVMGIWYLFGDSPTFEQTLLVLIITFLFKIQTDVTFNSITIKNLKTSFMHLADDFKKHIKHK